MTELIDCMTFGSIEKGTEIFMKPLLCCSMRDKSWGLKSSGVQGTLIGSDTYNKTIDILVSKTIERYRVSAIDLISIPLAGKDLQKR